MNWIGLGLVINSKDCFGNFLINRFSLILVKILVKSNQYLIFSQYFNQLFYPCNYQFLLIQELVKFMSNSIH